MPLTAEEQIKIRCYVRFWVLILGLPRGPCFGGPPSETHSRAPDPAVANRGGRASQLAPALRQHRASAGDSERGAAIPSVSAQVLTS